MYLLSEWWRQIWPNLAASGVTFVAGLGWARRRFLVEMERREAAHLRRHKELVDSHVAIRDAVMSIQRDMASEGGDGV